MPTGLQSFNDPASIGPLYPFAGTEVPLAIIGIALWILFHILQTREESHEWDVAEKAFDERVLLPGSDEPGRMAGDVIDDGRRDLPPAGGADELTCPRQQSCGRRVIHAAAAPCPAVSAVRPSPPRRLSPSGAAAH